MNTHGIKVFNRTDNDHIVFEIPHYLQFIFFPPNKRFLYNNLGNHAGIKAALGNPFHFFPVIGHATARSTKGKTGPDDERITNPFRNLPRLVHISNNAVLGNPEIYMIHGIPELLPVFRLENDRDRGTD